MFFDSYRYYRLGSGFTSLPPSTSFTYENPSPLILEASAATVVEEREPSIEEKIKAVFHEQPDIALALAKSESGLNPSMHSTTDRMRDGRAFSVGVMQTNLTVHRLGGKDCFKAFSGKNYKAVVVDESLYAECVKLAEDVDVNLATARGIYERAGSFNPWGAYTSGSYISKL